MTRITLSIAAALFATTLLFTPAAKACISCNYTPEVVNTPNPNDARGNKKKRMQAGKPRAPAAKKQQQAKTPPAKSDTAAAEPAKKSEPATPALAKAADESAPRLTGSSALMQQQIPQKEPVTEVADDTNGACKRFFPAVGMTLSVPCE